MCIQYKNDNVFVFTKGVLFGGKVTDHFNWYLYLECVNQPLLITFECHACGSS
jgi:uncharacterized protein (DUF486 family)